MVLRFEVNQAEAFRQGIDVEKSTNHLEVDPSKLSQEERNLIADRLDGIDVCQLEVQNGEVSKPHISPGWTDATKARSRIMAKAPTYEALLQSIKENQTEVEKQLAAARAKPLS